MQVRSESEDEGAILDHEHRQIVRARPACALLRLPALCPPMSAPLCYSGGMTADELQLLTADQVRHVAKLARLRPGEAEVERYRADLSSILRYVAMLQEVDVSEAEALAHPLDLHSRMEADEVVKPMDRAALERIAPMMEGPFIAVPKVLDDRAGAAEGGGAGGDGT
jgi:aspartyl-tRNA(Asn)/glutamyl-tRNA(Gln) amidotransferase subunit C